MYTDKYPVFYTVQACQKTCYQRHLIERCGCSDAYYPAINVSAFSYLNVPVCSITNVTQDDCKYEVGQQFAKNQLDCYCPNRCTEKSFHLDTTISSWPPNKRRAETLKRLKPKLGSWFETSDYDYVENNLVKLKVFFKEMVYKDYTESPRYSTILYISDLGGVFGLWFGFAVLAMAEICEFAADLVVVGIWNVMKAASSRCRSP